jgi:hypothetical protein
MTAGSGWVFGLRKGKAWDVHIARSFVFRAHVVVKGLDALHFNLAGRIRERKT